jgi:hypothetical protein
MGKLDDVVEVMLGLDGYRPWLRDWAQIIQGKSYQESYSDMKSWKSRTEYLLTALQALNETVKENE